MEKTTLDPENWDSFRSTAHRMLDKAIDKMQSCREGRVWTPFPQLLKDELDMDLPEVGIGLASLEEKILSLLPYGVGNTHPRFFGWVHGAGNPGGILAEIAGTAMNANLGGRDHGPIYVERQVLKWCRELMGFPEQASGLIVSGTSVATIIALKVARDQRLGFDCRETGIARPGIVGYASAQAHACVGRAFDLLGLGSSALRKIPCDSSFRMDLIALQEAILQDRKDGLTPFVIIGTAGSVNVGAIDDLNGLADIAAREKLWFHIDGAFGATAILSREISPRLKGIERADSLAFDFHKWLHVNYDAGCVLVRSAATHLQSFCGRPEYLADAGQGLAAGAPWPVDFGPELSRGFRALKVWAHLLEHGTEKLAAAITMNCSQARYLGKKIVDSGQFKLLAPVTLNIVCFRYEPEGKIKLDELNTRIVTELQLGGIAVPSTTRLSGKTAIRVNLTNHRTEREDLDLLLTEAARIGERLAADYQDKD